MVRSAKKDVGGRGSPEAIEKRRTARALNTLFAGKDGARKLDGRTEKRKARLLRELKDGRRGQPLKAIEVVSHGHELLELGLSLSAIRKNGLRAPKVDVGDEVMALVRRTQAAYAFRPEAWKLLGVRLDALPARPGRTKRGPRRRR